MITIASNNHNDFEKQYANKLWGNIGEWSEVYVFFTLLHDGKLYCAKDDLKPDYESFLEVLTIFRKGFADQEFKYCISDGTVFVSPTDSFLFEEKEVDREKLAYNANRVLLVLKSKPGTSFPIPDVEEFMNSIYMNKLKAPSGDKADIRIKTFDPKNGIVALNGFSIKSRLGHAPTLINSSSATNFRYELLDFDDEKMQESYNFPDAIPRMKYVIDSTSVRFVGAVSRNAHWNLGLLDPRYEEIISFLLLESYRTGTLKISDLCQILDKKDVMNTGRNDFFEFKIKKLLIQCALGMNFGSSWDGKEDANGGFITVGHNGEVFAYHFFNRSIVEKYLYESTKLERGSRKRHNYGFVFKENGKYYIDLNFAVRFI